jgi:hypothetical protein
MNAELTEIKLNINMKPWFIIPVIISTFHDSQRRRNYKRKLELRTAPMQDRTTRPSVCKTDALPLSYKGGVRELKFTYLSNKEQQDFSHCTLDSCSNELSSIRSMFACLVHASMIVPGGAVVVVVVMQAPASLGWVLVLDDLPASRRRAQGLAQPVLPPLPHRHRRPPPLPAVAPDAVATALVLAAAPAEFPHLHVPPATVDAPGVAEAVPEAAARAAQRAEEAHDDLPR